MLLKAVLHFSPRCGIIKKKQIDGGNTMDNGKYTGKVVLLNGSPHKAGTTAAALSEVAAALEECGIKAEIIHVGASGHRGCQACGYCKKAARCVFDDGVNEIAEALSDADGLVLGSPVYYASPNGDFLSVLDRLFHSSKNVNKHMMVGASVACARRGGCTATFDALNKYFTISGMPIVSSNYWNQVHGSSADDARCDLEGMQTMRTLGKNMAFLIRAIKAEKAAHGLPTLEEKIFTNFIKK